MPVVELEPLLPEYAAGLFEDLADPAGYRFVPGEPPASVSALRLRFERQAVGRSPDGAEIWLNWVVRRPGHGCFIGLTQATIRNRVAQIAYHVFPKFWREGVGTAAVRATLSAVFARVDVDEAQALIDTRNAASIALVRKLGFEHLRTIAHADHFKGSRSDEHEFAIPRQRMDAGPGPPGPGGVRGGAPDLPQTKPATLWGT